MKIILNDTTFTENKLELTGTYNFPSEIELKIIKNGIESTITVKKSEIIRACQTL